MVFFFASIHFPYLFTHDKNTDPALPSAQGCRENQMEEEAWRWLSCAVLSSGGGKHHVPHPVRTRYPYLYCYGSSRFHQFSGLDFKISVLILKYLSFPNVLINDGFVFLVKVGARIFLGDSSLSRTPEAWCRVVCVVPNETFRLFVG